MLSTHITEGNKAFLSKRFLEALHHYEAVSKDIDPQLISYNIYKCKSYIAEHSHSLEPGWAYSYYDSDVLNEKITDKKYVVGMASMPSRIETLEKVIHSILPQVDEIHIFLNNFSTVPPFLYKDKIHIHRSQEHGDQRDNGKFFGLNFADNDCYYFTLDDDIYYPRGYFNLLASKLISYSNKVAVGVHGVIYAPKPKSFFDRITFNFERELLADIPVSVLGTGTTGFYTGEIKPPFDFFTATGMADLFLGAYLKENGCPAICVARPSEWLHEYHRDDRSDTIYHETKSASTPYDNFLIKNAPWGAGLVIQAITAASIRLPEETRSFLEFVHSLPSVGVSNKHIENHYGPLFTCAGLYPYSDYYYIDHAKVLLHGYSTVAHESVVFSTALSIAKAVLGNEFERDAQKHEPFDVQIAKYSQSILENYALESQNPELALLLSLLNILHSQKFDIASVTALANAALKTGQSNIVVAQLPDFVLRQLDVELIFTLLKAAILEKSEAQEKLLLCLSETDQTTHTSIFLKAMYDTAQNSPTCEKSMLNVIHGRYRARNKSRHLNEIMRFALDCGTPILPSTKYDILLDNAIDTAVKRVLLDALMTEGKLKNQKSVDAIIKNLGIYDFDPIETKFRTAELKRQVKNNSQNVLNSINECFRMQGMSTITRPSKTDSFFSDIKANSKLTPSKDLGTCTVIIAAYNAYDTLQYAYDSICNQTYPNLEVIIVDDFNDVPVDSFIKLNPNIPTKLLRNTSNQGPYGCRNVAIEHMTGSYFVIHDADDWAHPEKLALQIESIHGSEHVCSYARHIRVTADGSLKLENHGNFIGHGPMTSLFKSKILSQIGIFDFVATRGDMEYKARVKRFYGENSIFEDSRLMLLSLDWHSNSKQKTSSLNKAFKLSHYKNSYSKWHSLMPFMRAA